MMVAAIALAGDRRYLPAQPAFLCEVARFETNWNSFVGLQSNDGVGIDVGWSACFHGWDRLFFADLA